MSMRHFALVGNPNAGKTTLFNELTGTSQHVGNWPGVTVEKKAGSLRAHYGGEAEIVDTPGIYSINPHSIEERVTRAYLVDFKPDVVIDVVEATNIERNLFLTCQIAELGVPMVVALNMMDEAEKAGDRIDIEALSRTLGLPVVPITAVKGEGVIELMNTTTAHALVNEVTREAEHPYHVGEDEHGHGFQDIEDPEEHRLDHHTDAEGRTNALLAAYKYHNHYKGPKVYQPVGDKPLSDEKESDNAKRRYEFIAEVMEASVTKGSGSSASKGFGKADRILTHPVLGIPLFLLVVFFMFHCTFSSDFLFLSNFGISPVPSPGIWLQNLATMFIGWVKELLIPLFDPGSWAYGLVIDGIIGGVGSVLSFLPQICVLFFYLTLLEDIGYMSRVAFIMDRLLRTFGLSGKSFLPMMMGFGCNVPAAMACRTMENEEDRKMTLFLVPFMSCGARAPIFLVFAGAFFPQNADIVVFSMYLLGIVVAIVTGLILKKVVFKGETTPLVIELPRYRMPRLKSMGLALWKTIKDYVERAGTVIFVMSVVVWFLSSFGVQDGAFGMVDTEYSLLAVAGGFIAPIFSPLGFGFWTAAVALLTGFAAKEAVIGTMGVLYGFDGSAAVSGTGSGFTAALTAAGFTPLVALSFMVFSLLYTPCAAVIATLKREFNSWKWTFAQIGYSLCIAWVLAFIVYQVGSLLGFA